jgi:hypothetical protein
MYFREAGKLGRDGKRFDGSKIWMGATDLLILTPPKGWESLKLRLGGIQKKEENPPKAFTPPLNCTLASSRGERASRRYIPLFIFIHELP